MKQLQNWINIAILGQIYIHLFINIVTDLLSLWRQHKGIVDRSLYISCLRISSKWALLGMYDVIRSQWIIIVLIWVVFSFAEKCLLQTRPFNAPFSSFSLCVKILLSSFHAFEGGLKTMKTTATINFLVKELQDSFFARSLLNAWLDMRTALVSGFIVRSHSLG